MPPLGPGIPRDSGYIVLEHLSTFPWNMRRARRAAASKILGEHSMDGVTDSPSFRAQKRVLQPHTDYIL
jgi:hypothetical protein